MNIKNFLLEHGIPDSYKFKTDGNPYYIDDCPTFKGWYIWKEKNNHTYIRLHRWKDSSDFFYSTDESNERYKEDPKTAATLIKQKLLDQKASCKRYQDEWHKLKLSSDESKYVKKKKVKPSSSVKIAYDIHGGSSVFIPCYSDWGFTGYQQITDDGFKSFCSGQRVEATYSILGFSAGLSEVEVKKSTPILVCEGWATGETVRELWSEMRGECLVVVSWNASNLPKVANLVRKQFPTHQLVLVSDNDCWKEVNTGQLASEEAALSSFGSVLLPVFSSDMNLKKPTDWNDLFLLSADTAKSQIASHKTVKPPEVHCLGYFQDDFFLSSSENPQILAVKDPSDTQLMKLLPLKYWTLHYPKLSNTGVSLGVDWSQAKSDVMESCRKRGLFDRATLRGRGFWKHEDRVIVSTGSKMWDQGKWCEVRDYGSQYVYQQDIPLDPTNPMPEETRLSLLQSLQKMKFERDIDPHLLLGWIIAAPLAGVTEWRPHIWITGEKGAGKSTVLEYVIRPAFSAWTSVRADKSSEAGLRQTLKNDAVPVIMDEFEPEKGSHSVLNLLRVASSNSGPIRKGTPGGKALEFTARFNACMASIQIAHLDPADESRIEILHLKKNSEIPWNEVKTALTRAFNQENSRRLMAWLMNGGAEAVLKEQERVRALLEEDMDARAAQQYGALLGACVAFTGVEGDLPKKIVQIVKGLGAGRSEGEDYKNCLNAILEIIVRVGPSEKNIAELIADNDTKVLALYGIRIMETGEIAVKAKSAELIKRLPAKYQNYAQALRRIKGASEKNMRIGGTQGWCVVLDSGVEGNKASV